MEEINLHKMQLKSLYDERYLEKSGKRAELFKVIVAGSRSIVDYDFVSEKLDSILKEIEDRSVTSKNFCILSGGARGVDRLGEIYAKQKLLKLQIFPANWNKYGNRAGYIRNAEMAEVADVLIAFWDGESKGTKHMIDIAKKKGLEVIVIK